MRALTFVRKYVGYTFLEGQQLYTKRAGPYPGGVVSIIYVTALPDADGIVMRVRHPVEGIIRIHRNANVALRDAPFATYWKEAK